MGLTANLRDWSDPEKYAALAALATTGIWAFLAMRLMDGFAFVDVPARHLLLTYVAAVALTAGAYAAIAAALARARLTAVALGRIPAGVEHDERDREIEARAERIAGWLVLAGVNFIVVHAIATAAYADGRALPLDLAATTTPVFALLTVPYLGHLAKHLVTLWLYRR